MTGHRTKHTFLCKAMLAFSGNRPTIKADEDPSHGANGYIGLRLLPELLELGHTVCAVVRNKNRLPSEDFAGSPGRLDVIEADLLSSEPESRGYRRGLLSRSLHGDGAGFAEREAVSARHFLRGLERTRCRQII